MVLARINNVIIIFVFYIHIYIILNISI